MKDLGYNVCECCKNNFANWLRITRGFNDEIVFHAAGTGCEQDCSNKCFDKCIMCELKTFLKRDDNSVHIFNSVRKIDNYIKYNKLW